MSEKETDVISHLLDLEGQAAELILEAQTEADKRILKAKNDANTQFKERFAQITETLESEYNKSITESNKKHDEAVAAYKDKVSEIPQDKKSFDKLLDSFLSIA